MKRVAYIVALSLVGICGADAKDLSGDQIKDMVIGKKLSWLSKNGSKGSTVYSPDGTASVTVGGKPDKGKWRINGSKLCVTWTWIRDGKEGCFTIAEADADGKYQTSTGITFTDE